MDSIRDAAIKLRRGGDSYNMISQKIDVPKSTLSNWLSKIPFKPNKEVLERVSSAKLRSALFKQKIKFESIKKAETDAKKDIGTISRRDLFMLGIGLYMGEGEKSHENIKIVNSDPKIIRLAIRWFTAIGDIEVCNLKPSVYSHPDKDVGKIIKFWSKETGIPIEQFGKTIIDRREDKSVLKRSKLPHGTLSLRIKSNGKQELGVNLHRKILAWIDNCTT